LILAPLLAPLLLVAAGARPPEDIRWLPAFLVLMVLGCIVSYGATDLPLAAVALSAVRTHHADRPKVCLLGLVLAR